MDVDIENVPRDARNRTCRSSSIRRTTWSGFTRWWDSSVDRMATADRGSATSVALMSFDAPR